MKHKKQAQIENTQSVGTDSGKTNKKQSQKRHRFGWRDFLIIVIPAVAAIAVVCVALLTAEHDSTYHLPDNGKQYYAGSSAALSRGDELQVDNNGRVIFGDGAEGIALPIYLNGSNTLVLTSDMVYYMPRSDRYTRLAALSEVELSGSSIEVRRGTKSVNPELGFLFDGKDFYLFLEPVTISFMGYTVDLPALSYAEVKNGGDIMLFNYQTKEFTIETLLGGATAKTEYGDYSISLLGDSMTNIKGELTLLVTKPRALEPLV